MRDEGPQGEAAKSYSVSVNMLCIIGATVGVFSLFLPWIWNAEGNWRIDFSLYDALLAPRDTLSGWWEGMFGVSLVVFVCGTILAYVFPIACGIQAFGVALFYVDYLGTDLWIPSYERGLSIGFFVAVASIALVAASLIVPWRIGSDVPENRWSKRTWTAYRTRAGNGQKSKQSLASPLDVLHALGRDRKWAAALLATVLLLLATVYYAGETDGAGSVECVDGRIVIEVGDSATYQSWPRTTLRVSDGSETVEWSLELYSATVPYDECAAGEWMSLTLTLDAKDLSELSVAPAVIDYGGERGVTQADRVILTPQNGTSFAEDTEYTVAIHEDVWATDIPYTHLYVTFKLADDDVSYEFEIVRTEGFSISPYRPYYILAWGAVIVFVALSIVVYSSVVKGLRRTDD